MDVLRTEAFLIGFARGMGCELTARQVAKIIIETNVNPDLVELAEKYLKETDTD